MTPITPAPLQPPTASDVIALLREQKAAILQLQTLGREQRRLIETGESDGLLRLLQRRQRLIDSLRAIGDRIAPLREQLTPLADAAPPDQAQEMRHLLDHVQTMFAELIQTDDEDRRTLQASRDGVAQQLRETKSAGRAFAAYGPRPGTPNPAAVRAYARTDRHG